MQRLRILLLPSQISGLFCVFIALLVCGVKAWSYIRHNQLFYEYLFDAYGFNTLLLEAPNSVHLISDAILNSSATYYALLLICGVLASLTVYAIMQAVSNAKQATSEVLHEMHEPGQLYKQAVRESFLRLGLRAASLIGWTVFIIVFLSIFAPLSISLLYIGIDHISDDHKIGWLIAAAGCLIIALCLHIHVVFARLTWLKPRLFGGDKVIEELEHGTKV